MVFLCDRSPSASISVCEVHPLVEAGDVGLSGTKGDSINFQNTVDFILKKNKVLPRCLISKASTLVAFYYENRMMRNVEVMSVSTIDIDSRERDCVKWIGKCVQNDLWELKRQGAQIEIPVHLVAGTYHPKVQKILRDKKMRFQEDFLIQKTSSEIIIAAEHFRGTMYGLLEISRRVGVDPLGYFTDNFRLKKFKNLKFPIEAQKATFEFRGAFINQEDLLAGWKGDKPIPMSVYRNIFLCILRLGGNMVLPATYISPNSPILDLASKCGLILAQHHFQILGTDVNRLSGKTKQQYSFVRFPRATEAVWRESIRINKHRETVWTLGLRGSNDEPFWECEKNNISNKKKGEIISSAIKRQYQLLIEEFHGKPPPCAYYLYRENQILYQKGYLQIPKEVIIVWCDNGYGHMESYFRNGYELSGMAQRKPPPATGRFLPAWPKSQTIDNAGLYYHVSFYDSCAPNRVQYVHPDNIQKTIAQAVDCKIGRYFLLNVGNIREFVLGIETAFDIASSPEQWLTHRKEGHYLSQWCAARYGERLSRQISSLYSRFYNSHMWWPTDPHKCCGDSAVHWLLEDCIKMIWDQRDLSLVSEHHMPALGSELRLQMIRKNSAKSLKKWEMLVIESEHMLQKLEHDTARFFTVNFVAQAKQSFAIMLLLNGVASAVIALKNDNPNLCFSHVKRAKTGFAQWVEASRLSLGKEAKWRSWHKGDVIQQIKRVEHYLKALDSLCEAMSIKPHKDIHLRLAKSTM